MSNDIICDYIPVFIINEDNIHLDQKLTFILKQLLISNNGKVFVNLFLGMYLLVNFPINNNYKGYIIFHKYGTITSIVPLNEMEIYELKSIKFTYEITHRSMNNIMHKEYKSKYINNMKKTNEKQYSRFFIFPES